MKINKKNIFISLSFLIPLINIFAQPGIKGGFVVSGFKPSYNDVQGFSDVDFRPFLGYEVGWVQYGVSYPDFAWQLGVFYTSNLSHYFAIQPEILLAQRGYRFYLAELYNTSYKLKVTYFQLPLLLKYKIPLKWKIQPGFLAGPYLAFKLNANRTINIWGDKDTKNIPNIRKFDYGLVSAIDSEFSAWSRKFLLEFRFNWGISSIMTQPKDYIDLYDDPGKVQILAINFMAGYRF